jgi:hypothetical protein
MSLVISLSNKPGDGYARPLGDDLGDIGGVDLFFQHLILTLQRGEVL